MSINFNGNGCLSVSKKFGALKSIYSPAFQLSGFVAGHPSEHHLSHLPPDVCPQRPDSDSAVPLNILALISLGTGSSMLKPSSTMTWMNMAPAGVFGAHFWNKQYMQKKNIRKVSLDLWWVYILLSGNLAHSRKIHHLQDTHQETMAFYFGHVRLLCIYI